jgi:hypothetical protein
MVSSASPVFSSALSNVNLSEHLIRGAIFASEFTWTNRTLKMLSKF